MKKILSVLFVLLLLASCGGYNPPDNPGTNNSGNNGGSGGSIVYPSASFGYTTAHPFKVIFTNTSKKATSYIWDFGDGTTSKEENPSHRYNSKGVYKVTLTARRGDYSDKYSANITIEAPTKCYATGIVYEKVPKYNEYYNIRFTDDYLLFETLYWNTNWVMLSSANLPYTYMLNSKKQIDLSISEYVLRLYKNSSTSGGGTQIDNWSVFTSNLKSNYPEKLTATGTNSKVLLLLEWAK